MRLPAPLGPCLIGPSIRRWHSRGKHGKSRELPATRPHRRSAVVSSYRHHCHKIRFFFPVELPCCPRRRTLRELNQHTEQPSVFGHVVRTVRVSKNPEVNQVA